MEPLKSDNEDYVLQLGDMSLEDVQAASRTLNGRDFSYGQVPAAHEKISQTVDEWLVGPSMVTNNNNNNNNNNDNHVVSPQVVAHAQIEILQAGMKSYEACLEAIQKHASLIFSEKAVPILDTYLHSIDMLAAPVRPKDAPSAYAFLAAINQVGNRFDGFCSVKERLIGRALDLDLSMLVEILTTEQMDKEALCSIAARHEDKELEEWLKPAILRDLAQFRKEIQKEPQDVYEKTKAFFVKHSEIHTFRNPNDGNTLLHEAFLAYISDQAIGAIEFAVLLELGMKKGSRNEANISVEEMAQNSELGIFIKLLKHEAPTKETLLDIVLQELTEHSDDPLLQSLSEWLTQ